MEQNQQTELQAELTTTVEPTQSSSVPVAKKESKLFASIILFALAWLVYTGGYFARVNYSDAMTPMIDAGILATDTGGLISSVYFICYALGQVVNGFLAERKSPFVMVLIGMLVIIISNVAMSVCSFSPVLLVIMWGVNGFGQSMLWAPIYFVVTNVLNPKITFTAITCISLCTPAGKMIGHFIAGLSLTASWQATFYVPAIIVGVVAMGWVAFWLTSKKAIVIPERKQKLKKVAKEKMSLFNLIIKSGLLVAMPSLIVHGIIVHGTTEWIPYILQTYFGYGESESAFISILIYAIGIISVFLCNLIYKKFFPKNEVAAGLSFMGISLLPAITLMLLCFNPGATFGVSAEAIIFVVMFGLLYTVQLAFSHLLISLAPARCSVFALGATMSGINNAMTYGGAAIATFGLGFAVQVLDIWQLMLIILVCVVIATLCLIFAVKPWKKFVERSEFLQNQ